MHGGNPEAQPTNRMPGLDSKSLACTFSQVANFSQGCKTTLWMYGSHHDATTSSRTSTF
uniref:Uncharacterized protein n=1 Tax=Coccidioides posadasii RMSCC 3488 TaxID=454284 RepID=A0A0J6F5V9_COCPO|nr:hypothetical protein CPAG_04641 [Coccidioides posadasii RMSCC 3488]